MNDGGETAERYEPTQEVAPITQPQEAQLFSILDAGVRSEAAVTPPPAEDGSDQADPQTTPDTVPEGDISTAQQESGDSLTSAEGEAGAVIAEATDEQKSELQRLKDEDPAYYDVIQLGKEGMLRNLQQREGLSDEVIEHIRDRFDDAMPKDVVDYVVKLRILLDLRNEYSMSDEEFRTFEAWAETQSAQELADYSSSLIPDFVFETYRDELRKDVTPTETEGDSAEGDSEDITPLDEQEDPLDKNQQVELDDEGKLKEAETTARAAKLAEQEYKLAAWKEFRRYKAEQGDPIPLEPTLPEDPQKTTADGEENENYDQEYAEYVTALQQYKDLKQLYDSDMQRFRKEFEDHWKDNCVPRIDAEQRFIQENPKPTELLEDGTVNPNYQTELAVWEAAFEDYYDAERNKQLEDTDAFDKKGKTLKEQLKKLGLDWAMNAENVDAMTLLKTIFGTDSYRAGNEAIFRSEATDAQAIDVLGFRELCNWSTSERDKKSNRKKWALLTGLMLKHLDPTNYPDTPSEWANDDKLDDDTLQNNMQTLYEEAAKAGKQKVDKAFNDAFEDPLARSSPDAQLARPRKKVQVTSELMTHFQILATDRNHLKEFFR